MPGISGTEVLKKIREKNIEIPVFVISAWDGAAVGEHVMDIGANEYFPKPTAIKLLRSKIEEELKKAGKFIPKPS